MDTTYTQIRMATQGIAGWLEVREPDLGPYSEFIIKFAREQEAEIQRLRDALMFILQSPMSDTKKIAHEALTHTQD